MEIRMKSGIYLFFLLISVQILPAQSEFKQDDDPRVAQIAAVLETSATAGKLSQVARKNQYSGTLEYQLSWTKGGKLLHSRNLKSMPENHLFVSRFQKVLMKQKAGVKIRKGEQLKMLYTFRF